MNIAQTNKLGSSHFSFQPINDVEVKSVIEALKPNKAAGHDLIPPIAVKASVSTISQPLSVLINTIIHRSQVPETWKRGDISPIHKKKSTLYKTNYRSITILPAFSIVFERVLHMQMSEYFEKVFHNYMFAYHEYHGCAAALLSLTEQ